MKRLSKYVKIAILSLTVLTLSSGAGVGAVTKSPAVTPKESAFCTNLAANISKIDTNITTLKAKLAASRVTRDQAIANDRTKLDQQLKDDRSKWDQQRQDNFTKLEARAKTDAQTSAVKTYEAAIISTVNTRRSANDTARVTYRSGVNSALATQRSTIDGQVTTFSSSVSSAEATAQAGCQATPSNGPVLRTAFQTSLKSARENYTSERKADGNISSQIKQLAATRDASFQSNDTVFKKRHTLRHLIV